MRRPRRVVIVSASVGAGHDGAAQELARRLGAAGFAVDRYDFVDLLPARLGRLLRAGYRRQLDLAPGSWPWLLAVLEHHPWAARGAAGVAATAGRRLRTAIGGDCAAVVSTYPVASQALGRLRRCGQLSVPAVTFLTDLSVHRLWVAAGVDVHLALHPVPAAQAAALGAARVHVTAPAVAPAFTHPPGSPLPAPALPVGSCRPVGTLAEPPSPGPPPVIHRLLPAGVAGPALDPHGGGSSPAGVACGRRAQARRRFGLPPAGRLALVVTGSWGVGEAEQSARDIAATGLAVPVVACGHNGRLRERLTAARIGVALGWVDDMPALMRACDLVVQNAGGLTSLEAFTAGAAVVTYRCLPGHGTSNADALDRAGLATWIRHHDHLGPVLADVLDGPRGPAQRAAAAALTRGPDPARIIAAIAAPRAERPARHRVAAPPAPATLMRAAR